MRSTLLSLLLLFVLASCSSDDDKTRSGDGSYFKINVNGQELTMPRRTFIANENCGYIYATIMDVPEDYATRFRMEFELTTAGYINKVRFIEHSDNSRHFETVVFQPAETFTISNFSYDGATGRLHFDFEGYLYEMEHPENKKFISGKMQYNDMTSPACSFFLPRVNVNHDDMHFTKWIGSTSGGGYIYDFYSDEGYVLRFASDAQLKDMQPGTYSVMQGSSIRILLFEYKGDVKATFDDSINSADWEYYSCEGTFTIGEQNTLPFSHTTGTFTFEAADADGNFPFGAIAGSFAI